MMHTCKNLKIVCVKFFGKIWRTLVAGVCYHTSLKLYITSYIASFLDPVTPHVVQSSNYACTLKVSG